MKEHNAYLPNEFHLSESAQGISESKNIDEYELFMTFCTDLCFHTFIKLSRFV